MGYLIYKNIYIYIIISYDKHVSFQVFLVGYNNELGYNMGF